MLYRISYVKQLKERGQLMKGIYRNLNAKKVNNGSDAWSIVNAHESNGYVVKETGVTHGVFFSLSNILINNPSSKAKGCLRIN